MWSIWLIVGVAAAAAVGLMVPGIFLGVFVERRRNRNWMRNHGFEQVTTDYNSRHARLSVNDEGTEPPVRRDLRSKYQLPRSSTGRTWITISSDDHLQTEMAMIPENEVLEQPVSSTMDFKRVPRFSTTPSSKPGKRQRRLTKFPPKHSNPYRFPHSKTEVVEKIDGNFSEPIELPTHNTSPKNNLHDGLQETTSTLPEGSSLDKHPETSDRGPLGNPHIDGDVMKNEQDAWLSRNDTADFLSCAPIVPLPPLPNVNTFQAQTKRSKSVASATSIETISSSVLGTLVSSHAEIPTPRTKTQSQALKEFDFGLGNNNRHQYTSTHSHIDTSRSGDYLKLFPSVTNIEQNATSRRLAQLESEDSLKTIDASSWNDKSAQQSSPKTLGTYRWTKKGRESHNARFSPIDREDVGLRFDSPQSSSRVGITSVDGSSFSRPASITDVDLRESVINSASSPTKGHRRQNCVRIKNLTPVDSNRRISRQVFSMSELKEEETITEAETPTFSVIDVEEGQKIRSARPSIIEITNSPSPIKPKKTYLKRYNSNESRNSRSESEVFGVFTDDLSSHRGVANVRNKDNADTPKRSRLLDSTSPGNIKMNLSPSSAKTSNTKSMNVDIASSPILPSPAYDPSKLSSRTSGVKGPRPQPITYRPNRNESISPLRRKSPRSTHRKTNEADLRRSIMILRSMSCRDDLAAGESSGENSENSGESNSASLSPPSPNVADNLRLAPPALRHKRSSTMSAYGQRSPLSKRHRSSVTWNSNPKTLVIPERDQSRCNSIVSWYSESSLWEDVSVRTSPDLDMSTTPNKTLNLGMRERLDAMKEEDDVMEELALFQPQPRKLGTMGQLVLKPTVNVGTDSD